ncbi:hypothetical protein [Proteus phage vB_PmiP_RS10pmA]|nr:hypothetical protein [Proteus phage vB_PmiP_RS10pmA]
MSIKVIVTKPFYISLDSWAIGSRIDKIVSHKGRWLVQTVPFFNNREVENLIEHHRFTAKPTKKQLRKLHKLSKQYLINDINK